MQYLFKFSATSSSALSHIIKFKSYGTRELLYWKPLCPASVTSFNRAKTGLDFIPKIKPLYGHPGG